MSKAFIKIVSAVALAACAASAAAQEATKVVMGISGWTGYGPLSLAEKTGLFKKHGIEAEIKMIPQKKTAIWRWLPTPSSARPRRCSRTFPGRSMACPSRKSS